MRRVGFGQLLEVGCERVLLRGAEIVFLVGMRRLDFRDDAPPVRGLDVDVQAGRALRLGGHIERAQRKAIAQESFRQQGGDERQIVARVADDRFHLTQVGQPQIGRGVDGGEGALEQHGEEPLDARPQAVQLGLLALGQTIGHGRVPSSPRVAQSAGAGSSNRSERTCETPSAPMLTP